jgi:hypothetical protein
MLTTKNNNIKLGEKSNRQQDQIMIWLSIQTIKDWITLHWRLHITPQKNTSAQAHNYKTKKRSWQKIFASLCTMTIIKPF